MSLQSDKLRIQAYIDPDLYKKIQTEALKAHRYMSQQVEWMLQTFSELGFVEAEMKDDSKGGRKS